MATLVKFRVHPNGDLFAYFPRLNAYRNNNDIKICYSHIGQHSACAKEYERESRPATPNEYESLKRELEQVGYSLKVCK